MHLFHCGGLAEAAGREKPELVETISAPQPIIEPTDDPIDEPTVVAKVVETKPVKTIRKPPKAPPKPKTSNLTVNISSSFKHRDLSQLTCAGYSKQKNGKSMTSTIVPSGDCKLQSNPTGLSYRGSFAGKSLTCTVSSTAKCK